MADTCKVCRYFVKNKGDTRAGRCHRSTPLSLGLHDRAVWAIVPLGAWCGEFSTVCGECRGMGWRLEYVKHGKGIAATEDCPVCGGTGWRTAATTPPGGAGSASDGKVDE